MSLIRPAAVAVALSALACLPALPGAGLSQARASAGPSNLPFRGCGQSLTTSDWAQGHIIRNSSCTILENATRGWQQPPLRSSNHGTIARGSGPALYAQSIANSAGRGAWMQRSLGSGRDCSGSWSSTCIGSGRQGRSPFAGWGSVVRPQEWSGSVCTAARGSTTWCRSTANYGFATAEQLGLQNTPVLQEKVLELTGSNAAMQVVSRGNDVPTCSAARLAYVICAAPAGGAARAAGTRENRVDRVVVTNRLVTVQINNNIDQRLNLTGSSFGTWARDPRAEYRTDARLANGEKNNSTSLAPYAAGIAGEAYWGALLPATARSTATFAYTYADTVTDGRTRTQFTGNRVTLTVQLNESGDNVGSTCVVFTPALRSQARCSGTGEGGVVQVTRSKTDSYVEINVGPS